ncbi:ABC transporter substrate-binding protein [uncultured Mailhella sp.]|uniref:ABC transporter substrate-binding protein n=1 Tax=uncultured Mailhella sp. TaxID=1981031 RepID=UPI0025EC979D|nr:ABC transporter substrate-binding protein [uncultured Mailhella sp.]
MLVFRTLFRMAAACLLVLACLPAAAFAASPISFTDMAGRKVELDARPETFVVANYIANFLMVGGAESLNRVVGMTFDGWADTRYGEYVVYTQTFPELKNIPSIGGYHDDVLDSERILSLHPDVLLVGLSQFADNNQKIDLFERAGIRVVVLDYHAMKVENHTRSTMILGQLLGRENVAKEQCDAYASALENVYAKIAALPDSARHRKVYMELGNKGTGEYGNSYNGNVLWGAMLKNLGADNLAEHALQPYAPLDTEFVLAADPDVIVMGGGIWRNNAEGDQMLMGLTVDEATAQQRLRGFADRPAWKNLSAVRNGEVYAVDHGSLRNMIDYTLTLYLAKILYPDTFRDLEPMAEMQAFYARYLPELKFDGTFMIRLER